jgi:uncharacterized glyoxalase superfamily metalloenzyme YdcJ
MPDAPMTPRRRASDVDEDGYVTTAVVPTPDPTALTTAALHRETGVLRESIDQRFDDRDREARSLARERGEQFAALKELMLQRIMGLSQLVDERFGATERQRLEQKSDTKAAVDAALTAQKEAVKEQTTASDRSIAKSELATGKQLEQQQETSATAIDGLRRSIEDLKERIAEVATTANTTIQQKVGAKEDRTALYATIAVLVSVIVMVLAIAGFLATRPGA